MATDTMFLRLVGGNAANPTLTDNKVSGHTFIGGADGAHFLKDTGPVAERFTTWAA